MGATFAVPTLFNYLDLWTIPEPVSTIRHDNQEGVMYIYLQLSRDTTIMMNQQLSGFIFQFLTE